MVLRSETSILRALAAKGLNLSKKSAGGKSPVQLPVLAHASSVVPTQAASGCVQRLEVLRGDPSISTHKTKMIKI